MPEIHSGVLPTTPPSRTLTIASVPSSHVYVRHIAAEQDDGVRRLPDPDPDVPTRSAREQWWPPVMLSRQWVEHHDFDVFHVQFGFDAWDPEVLADLADAVHERGRPFVQTVHDLRNPHHATRSLHDAQLAALLSRADEVLTLTPGAASEIASRFGRTAHVVPHPHVVDLDTMAAYAAEPRREPGAPFRVGLHVKSLRVSMDPLVLLPTLVRSVRDVGGVLQVNGHRDVLQPTGARYDADLAGMLRKLEAAGSLELKVHDFLDDDALWRYLASLDVSVLPYRFGTHSGWLEACRDLGTAVIAPTCGYYADQGPVHSFVLDEHSFDPPSLRRAVHDAHDAGRAAPVPVAERRAQRAAIAARHLAIYQQETRCASA